MESVSVTASGEHGLHHRYLDAQLRGDRRGALTLLLDALGAGTDVLQLQRDVIQPCQQAIGLLWAQHRISIAQEHMATAISQTVLAHLYERAPRHAPNGKKILVACVEGELHDFPARLVADALDLAGYDVKYLGANVPTESLIALLGLERPDLLALSITMSFNLPELRKLVARVRQHTEGALPIAIGGAACAASPASLDALDADVQANDAASMVTAAHQRLRLMGS